MQVASCDRYAAHDTAVSISALHGSDFQSWCHLQVEGSTDAGAAVTGRVLDVNKRDGIVDLSLLSRLLAAKKDKAAKAPADLVVRPAKRICNPILAPWLKLLVYLKVWMDAPHHCSSLGHPHLRLEGCVDGAPSDSGGHEYCSCKPKTLVPSSAVVHVQMGARVAAHVEAHHIL